MSGEMWMGRVVCSGLEMSCERASQGCLSTPRTARQQQLATAWVPSPKLLVLLSCSPLPKKPFPPLTLPLLCTSHISQCSGKAGGGQPKGSPNPSPSLQIQLAQVPPCLLPPLPIAFVNSAALKIPLDACSRKKAMQSYCQGFHT